jgi:hypothetical protein
MSTHEDHVSQLPPPLPTTIEKKKKQSVYEDNSELISRTPPHSTTPIFLPKYANSPPAGSGGKYMMKSKRTSWIVDAGVNNSNDSSIPTTPTSFPTRSRKTSVIATDTTNEPKFGSISKLRENRLPSPKSFDNTNHHRNSSISSVLTDNISAISSDGFDSSNDDDYASINMKCTCHYKNIYIYIYYTYY